MSNSANSCDKDKILIIEESRENVSWTNEVLSAEYRIYTASNSVNGMNIVFDNDIRLAVVDYAVCEGDGFEFFRNLKSSGLLNSFPIIISADSITDSTFDTMLQYGAVDIVSTHEKNAVLLNRVKQHILNKKKMDELRKLLYENEKLIEDNDFLRNKDPLTDVYNYSGFKIKAAEIIRNNPNINFEISFFDIKSFKYINELFGIECGNDVLKHWTSRLNSFLDENEIIGRYNSDRFILLSVFDENILTAERFIRLKNEMEVYLNTPGKPYRIEFATGIYRLHADDSINPDIDRFIALARLSHEESRQKSGTNVSLCSKDQWEQYIMERDICNHLTDAIENGEISVWLQPQFDYNTRRIAGAEALCRWNHPKYKSIRPDIFIKALEKSGQIYQLDRFVWEEVCKLLKELRKLPYANNLSLSINVSRKDFNQDVSPVDVITGLINKYSLNAHDLHIEITESAYDDNNTILIKRVEQFAKKGFIVELDDFGSGYSSINRLQDLCIGVLKLDKDFVQGAEHNDKSRNILETIVELGKKLEFTLIAEGVENENQAQLVGNLGCNIIQGFLLGKPMPIDNFCKLLEDCQDEIISEPNKILHSSNFNETVRERDLRNINMQEFVDALPVAIFRYQAEDEEKFSFVNKGLLHLLGYDSREQIKEKLDDKFINMVYEEDRDNVIKQIEHCISLNGFYDYCEYRIVTADNHLKWVCDYGHLVTDKFGQKWYDVVVCDIEKFRNKTENINERNQRYDIIVEKLGINVFEYCFADDSLNVYITKEGGNRNNKLIKDFSVNMTENCFVSSESAEILRNECVLLRDRKRLSGNFTISASLHGSKMHCYECEYAVITGANNEPLKMIGTAKNIDCVNSVCANTSAKSYFDKMTGHLNHDAAVQKIEKSLKGGRKGTLTLLEIEGLTELTIEYGSSVSEKIIVNIADALRNTLRKNDIIGRFADNSFIIFLRGFTEEEKLKEFLEKLNDRISNINTVTEKAIRINIGSDIIKNRKAKFNSSLKRAENSLCESKARSK